MHHCEIFSLEINNSFDKALQIISEMTI